MTEAMIVGLTILGCITVLIFFIYKNKKQQKAKQIMIEDLNKLSVLIHKRNQLVAEELKNLVDWTNQELYYDLTKLFVNHSLTEKFAKDEAFLIDVSNLLKEKITDIFERIAEKTKEDLEKLTKEKNNENLGTKE